MLTYSLAVRAVGFWDVLYVASHADIFEANDLDRTDSDEVRFIGLAPERSALLSRDVTLNAWIVCLCNCAVCSSASPARWDSLCTLCTTNSKRCALPYLQPAA